MAEQIKTIGVLTSGGDAPGMNAAVRAVVRTGWHLGLKVMGVYRGYNGLLEGGVIKELAPRDLGDTIQRGGTVLYTARSERFKEDETQWEAVENCKKLGIEGLVVVGGDGSFQGARKLSMKGIPCVGVPGTIDNDIASSSYTIGYDTAMNTAVEMVDKLRDTAQSHDRCSIVEVMGRHAGHLALNTGIACGATAILVPEVPYDFERDILERIEQARATGKQHFIIVVAEGVEVHVEQLAKDIEGRTGIESRATVLGHVQRGGSPTLRDRVIASQMGNKAVHLLKEGIGNRVVIYQNEKILDMDIYQALEMKKTIDYDLLEISKELTI